eukprot:2059378-Rhodomonas_salina.3
MLLPGGEAGSTLGRESLQGMPHPRTRLRSCYALSGTDLGGPAVPGGLGWPACPPLRASPA